MSFRSQLLCSHVLHLALHFKAFLTAQTTRHGALVRTDTASPYPFGGQTGSLYFIQARIRSRILCAMHKDKHGISLSAAVCCMSCTDL